MLTKEFIGLIVSGSGLSKKDAELLLATTTAIMRENLMDGKAIQLQGLGTLGGLLFRCRVVYVVCTSSR